MLDLEALDLSTSDSNPLPISREITPRSYKVNFIANLSNQSKFLTPCSSFFLQLKSQGRGEILVSLCYQPAANRITVVVLKARNLPKMDITGLSGKEIANINFSRILSISVIKLLSINI